MEYEYKIVEVKGEQDETEILSENIDEGWNLHTAYQPYIEQ